jgi:hypothetical protein
MEASHEKRKKDKGILLGILQEVLLILNIFQNLELEDYNKIKELPNTS